MDNYPLLFHCAVGEYNDRLLISIDFTDEARQYLLFSHGFILYKIFRYTC